MRLGRAALAVALAGMLVVPLTNAQAAKNVTCVLAGGVNLSSPANLLMTTMGNGSFSPSSLLRCTGAISGQGSGATGSFQFCQHNFVGPNPACHGSGYNQPNPSLDPIYDAINKGPAKVVAHAKGSASFSGFTGGVSCSLTFEGHALTTQAELTIKTFTCSNGFHATSLNKAVASALPIVNSVSGCPAGPGGAKLCFKSLTFMGIIAVKG
jgi:hypothetical protein